MILSFNILSCNSKPIKIGVINDIHFLSEKLMDDGESIIKYIQNSGRSLTDIPLVLDQVVTAYTNSDIEYLLIPGDITKDGEKQSHLDFVAKMQPLIDKGVKIFVIPGNHDINMPNSVGYRESSSYPVDNVSPKDFSDIYQNFGYGSAFQADSNSLSYAAELNPKTWLLAIDACLYKEYTDKSISAGRISPQTEQWVVSILQEAKKRNIRVIGMMHHALVEHFMFQEKLFPQYIVNDWERIASLFADNGFKIIFTGHFHANDITKYTSNLGNSVYDIETGALAAYPFAYRFVELTDKEMNITTKNITETPLNKNLAKDSKNILKKLAIRLMTNKIKQFGEDIPESVRPLVEQLAAELFILHIAGDEVINEDLKRQIDEIISSLNISFSLPPSMLNIDLSPADNNVKLILE